MGAVLWSGIKEVYYAATPGSPKRKHSKSAFLEDAESVGFGDKKYHDFVKRPEDGNDLCKYTAMALPNKLQPFKEWNEKVDKVPY